MTASTDSGCCGVAGDAVLMAETPSWKHEDQDSRFDEGRLGPDQQPPVSMSAANARFQAPQMRGA
jgi:hypothetical protein